MADRMDAEDSGFAAGLSICLTRDGQSLMQAPLDMAGFKILRVGNPTLPTDGINLGYANSAYLRTDGSNSITGNLTLENTSPQIRFHETDAVSPAGRFRFTGSSAGTFSFQRDNAPGDWSTASNIWQMSATDTVFNLNFPLQFAGAANHIRMKDSGGSATGYGVVLRNDSLNFYIMLTNLNDADGSFNSLRPFTVSKASGAVNIQTGLRSGSYYIGMNPAGVLGPGTISVATGFQFSAFSGLDTGTLFSFRNSVGTGVATIEPGGATVSGATAIITREKGDARYLELTGGVIEGSTYVETGNLVVGSNTASGSSPVPNVVIGGAAINIRRTGTTSETHMTFTRNITVAPSTYGSITSASGATAYNTSSDENLKDFTGLLDPQRAIDILRADPPREFDWKDGSGHGVGWGAQTSYSISPDLASPPPVWEPDEERYPGVLTAPKAGEPGYVPWGMDLSKRVPYLAAALVYALDKIDELTARIAALENA